MKQGLVLNIQRFTVHDGPGIRTEVFLKGCPLSCPWCSNPESQSLHPEPGIFPARCLGRAVCGLCEKAVSQSGIVSFDEAGTVCSIDRTDEDLWREAVSACPSQALKTWGSLMSVDDVLDVLEKDRRYYETSGGGMTLSGGEPLLQAPFAINLLRRCRQESIHTCLESTLLVEWETLDRALDHCDLLIADLKCVDSEKHARYTGLRNDVIQANLIRAAQRTDQIIVRIPVIPRFNDTPEGRMAFESFLVDNLKDKIREVQLLEFMHLGQEKCSSLERDYPMDGISFDRDELHESVLALKEALDSCGFNCTLGGAVRNGEKRK